MKIYTKTGDQGETSLIGGVRVKKSDPRIDAYGTIDELNAWIGVLRNIEEIHNPFFYQKIQDILFIIGSHLASHPEKGRMTLPQISDADIEMLENDIDKMELELTPLANFILPGSSLQNGFCHIARTVCRRAERCVVELFLLEEVESIIIMFLNRLSDHLFVLSRYLTYKQNGEDILWMTR